VVESVQGVASGVTTRIGNAADFVTSGPNEPSVADPDFGDATIDTGNSSTVDVGSGGDGGSVNRSQFDGINATRTVNNSQINDDLAREITAGDSGIPNPNVRVEGIGIGERPNPASEAAQLDTQTRQQLRQQAASGTVFEPDELAVGEEMSTEAGRRQFNVRAPEIGVDVEQRDGGVSSDSFGRQTRSVPFDSDPISLNESEPADRRLDTVSAATGQNVTVDGGEQLGDSPALEGADQFTDSLARELGVVGATAGNTVGNLLDSSVVNTAAANPTLATGEVDTETPEVEPRSEPDTVFGSIGAGAVETPALAGSLPATGVEAAEAGVFAVNQPDEFADNAPDAAIDAGLGAAEGVASNPARTAGTVAVSGGLSSAAFRATQGTRLGSVTRTSLQPIEETAKAAARRNLIDTDTATTIPGIREGQPGVPPSSETIPELDTGTGGTGSLLDRSDIGDSNVGLDRGSTPSTPTARGRTQLREEIGESDPVDVGAGDVFNTGERSLVDDQAASQLGVFRSPEARTREINDERLTPNLRQQTITRRQRELADATEAGTFEGEPAPFSQRSLREQRQADADAVARRRDVDTETDTGSLADGVGSGQAAAIYGTFDTPLGTGENPESGIRDFQTPFGTGTDPSEGLSRAFSAAETSQLVGSPSVSAGSGLDSPLGTGRDPSSGATVGIDDASDTDTGSGIIPGEQPVFDTNVRDGSDLSTRPGVGSETAQEIETGLGVESEQQTDTDQRIDSEIETAAETPPRDRTVDRELSAGFALETEEVFAEEDNDEEESQSALAAADDLFDSGILSGSEALQRLGR
jgi:hypothetical protein